MYPIIVIPYGLLFDTSMVQLHNFSRRLNNHHVSHLFDFYFILRYQTRTLNSFLKPLVELKKLHQCIK